jgi:hypothetical protein
MDLKDYFECTWSARGPPPRRYGDGSQARLPAGNLAPASGYHLGTGHSAPTGYAPGPCKIERLAGQ